MRNFFPLFQSHLDLAHHYWSTIAEYGDCVIDATCGNGYDTFKLCQLTLSNDKGKVYAFDIQSQAIERAQSYLQSSLSPELLKRIEWQERCHSTFPDSLEPNSVKLIVYNLGYLPGGDKKITTHRNSTLESLFHGLQLIKSGGVISITCYPCHPEGKEEEDAIIHFASQLSIKEWSCCHHRWLNRQKAPSLLLIQKNKFL